MAVIAVYSAKGGVGKTTLSVDLGWRRAPIGTFAAASEPAQALDRLWRAIELGLQVEPRKAG
jgi:Mrp family chromosome partitioning ATPase